MPDFPAVIDLSTLGAEGGFHIIASEFGEDGWSVASAGDVNGDGFDDLIVGSPDGGGSAVFHPDPYGGHYEYTSGPGHSYVVFGRAGGFSPLLDLTTLDGSDGFRLTGVRAGDESGFAVSSGDVNGDGFSDLIIGAPEAPTTVVRQPGGYDRFYDGPGHSYVVFGHAGSFAASISLTSLNGSNGFRLVGVRTGDDAGYSVASGGDINGDGFDDLIIGAPEAPLTRVYRPEYGGYYDYVSGPGHSYVVFGRADGFAASINLNSLNGTNGFRIRGNQAGADTGYSVAAGGDINGDGFDDLIIGAPDFGAYTIHHPEYGGYDEYVEGPGRTYVMFGHAGGFAANLDATDLNGSNGFRISGADIGSSSGFTVASAGDVNGDGFDDLVIGAPYANDENGETFVVFGHGGSFATNFDLATLDGSNGFRLFGSQTDGEDAESGYSVASAGDVNGDGFDDVIVGAPDGGSMEGGAAYVVFGGAAGFAASIDLDALDGHDGFRVEATDEDSEAGSRVSAAGDLNGDGIGDLIVASGDTGEAYVVYGRAPTTAVTRTGSAASQTIVGGAFADTLSGLGGDDALHGRAGNDALNGGTGNDQLDGGAGRDTMTGGAGDDVYLVDNTGDKVVEVAGQGIDSVISSVSYTLGAEVERLTLAGDAIKGTGNALANVIYGNAAANVLNGQAGDDAMHGGAGDDLYYVDTAGDLVVEGTGAGWDVVRAGVDYTLTANVEELFIGGAGRDGTGNALANTLHGSGSNNVLLGLGGDDIIRGGGGRDAIDGGDGADLLDGGVGKDTLTGGGARDVFQFRDGDFGTSRSLADVITDFSHADAEKIHLSLVDANVNAGGNQAFAFIGNGAFTGVAGQLHYAQAGGNTYVEGDTNGDGLADFVIALTGLHNLVASDFVL